MRPWHQIVTPREDLRDGRPLDASEFAVHLNQVVGGTAPQDYASPERFFRRTFPTRGLREIATEVGRRLSGERVNASPVINLTTQFGGGKTHALTMLYHLFSNGEDALAWPGVAELVEGAGRRLVRARVATFVGTEFDPVQGRSGPGQPTRHTPWGDIAWQLAGEDGYRLVAEHDRLRVRPGGEVLRALLDRAGRSLILMDEVLNFLNVARALRAGDVENRSSSLASQFLAFVQALSEEVGGRDGTVLVMALPKSAMEMSAEDEGDFNRLRKLSSRVDRPYILSSDQEIPEIIRRRLFEDLGEPAERRSVARAYARWATDSRDLLARDLTAAEIEASYPFHPTVLSVFERKWQTLPNFQRTRGVLRMLALWVSQTFIAAYRGGNRDALITLGTAPFEDTNFRAAVLEQVGESRLEATIVADIAGPQAHATRLDKSATGAIAGHRLHRALAAAIFFESSGGQSPERREATLPELRLAQGRPGLELGHLETALAALADTCFYLQTEANAYRFSLKPNLNMLLNSIRATLDESDIERRMREEIQTVFRAGGQLERRYFPELPANVPNAAVLSLVVMGPEHTMDAGTREPTLAIVHSMLADAGAAAPRAYRSALFFAVAGDASGLRDTARRVLALQRLLDQASDRGVEEQQRRQIEQQLVVARRDAREAVWQAYHILLFAGAKGSVETMDLGLLNSSAAESLTGYIESRLTQQDLLVESVSADWLARHRPPAAAREWPLRDVRDLFFSSPVYPRLRNVSSLRHTVAVGVERGLFGLAGRDPSGTLSSVRFREPLQDGDVTFGEDEVLIPPDVAEGLLSTGPAVVTDGDRPVDGSQPGPVDTPHPPHGPEQPPTGPKPVRAGRLEWRGELPTGKWALFYSRVLTKLVLSGGISVRIEVEAKPEGGLTQTQVAEIRQGLADLELGPPVVSDE